jgi:hypothetical protein
MTMPFSGQISLGDARTELSADYAPTSQITLNDTAVRSLFTKSGDSTNIQLSDGYGKRFRRVISILFTANQVNYNLCFSNLSGYVAGKTDVTLTINSGVYVYSTSTSIAGLTVACTTAGDTFTLKNNGYIMGMGGAGGDGPTATRQGKPGGTALKLGCDTVIFNNSYIAGGGGGGAANGTSGGSGAGGGGGAGGGPGGYGRFWTGGAPGGAGGGVGAVGSAGAFAQNGTSTSSGFPRMDSGGGGGGRILPGSGGAYGTVPRAGGNNGYFTGQGGGAGGGGGGTVNAYDMASFGGAGGAGSSSGNGPTFLYAGAGGGGWGAAGGNGHPVAGSTGGAGGKAIDKSGYTVTFASTGTLYGSVA